MLKAYKYRIYPDENQKMMLAQAFGCARLLYNSLLGWWNDEYAAAKKENADLNAAINIRNRVAEAVLCAGLLKRLDNGAYEPRKLKKEKVKEVLLSFRRSLAMQGREKNESIS